MAWARIATTNEDFHPLAGVEIECFNVDTLAVISVVESDLGGVAFFNGLPDDQRWFFKVRARRTSTRVQSTLDPARGRTYTGQIRLQILNMSPGALGKHAVVDKTGHGTHKTVQEAITSVLAIYGSGTHIVIHINPGTYTEQVTIDLTGGQFLLLEAQGMFVGEPWSSTYVKTAEITYASGHTITVGAFSTGIGFRGLRISCTSAAHEAVHYGTGIGCVAAAFADCYVSAVGRTVFGFTGEMRFRNCAVIAGADYAIAHAQVGAIRMEFSHCYLYGGAILQQSFGTLRIENSHYVAAGNGMSGYAIYPSALVLCSDLYIRDSEFNFGSSQSGLTSIGSCNDITIEGNRFIGSSKTGGQTCIRLRRTDHAVINDNHFVSFSTGLNFDEYFTVCNNNVICLGNTIAHCTTGILSNANGLDAKSVIGPNSFFDCTTDQSGVPAANDYQTGLATAHALLSTTHTDTLPAGVLDGDVIIGNVTPKWSRLAISIPAANVRNVLGIDNAELRPSWKTALDGTTPADIAAAGSAGTSLIFSHRDHVHKHPVFAGGSLHTEYELVGVAAGLIAIHAALADVHHAGFVGLTIAGPTNIDPNGGDRITIEDTASVTWASSGAGKIAATAVLAGLAHNLLSATHGDTTAHAAAVGGLITGQAGPVWAYLAVGAAGSGLWTDGTNVSWTVSPRYAGYLRVGSAAAPTNVTAGDLTAVRALIGTDAAIDATVTFDVEGNALVYGRMKVSNAERAIGVIPTIVLNISLYHTTALTSGQTAELQAMIDVNPAAASSATFYGMRLFAQSLVACAQNLTGYLIGADFITQHQGSGTLATMWAGHFTNYLTLGAGNAATVWGLYVQSIVFGGGSVAQVTGEVRGIQIDGPVLGAGPGVVANYYGIYLTGTLAGVTLDVGIRVEGHKTAALWLSSDTVGRNYIAWGSARDTNLYRSAANVLKTDDSLHVAINALAAGYVRVGSLSAPTNVTAGDLTCVRLIVGDAALGAGVEAAITGDATVSGFLRVGSATAPTNTTAGDLTAIRGIIGTDEALGASVLLDLNSVTGALLLSRMTTVQKAALTAVDGMVLYDTDLKRLQVRENGAWVGYTVS